MKIGTEVVVTTEHNKPWAGLGVVASEGYNPAFGDGSHVDVKMITGEFAGYIGAFAVDRLKVLVAPAGPATLDDLRRVVDSLRDQEYDVVVKVTPPPVVAETITL